MTSEPFITAEESTNPRRKGVWIMLVTWSVKLDDGRIIPWSFEVTTSTGYRAILPACGRIGAGEHGEPCVKVRDSRGQHAGQSVDAWCEHAHVSCHANHIEHARKLRDAVQKTYDTRTSAAFRRNG